MYKQALSRCERIGSLLSTLSEAAEEGLDQAFGVASKLNSPSHADTSATIDDEAGDRETGR